MTSSSEFRVNVLREEPLGLDAHIVEIELQKPDEIKTAQVQFSLGDGPEVSVELTKSKVTCVLELKAPPQEDGNFKATFSSDGEIRLRTELPLDSRAFKDDFAARLSSGEGVISHGERVKVPKTETGYIVPSFLTIQPGAVLKLEPGVRLFFAPEAGIEAQGTLFSHGDPQQGNDGVITLRSQADDGVWRGVLINGPAATRGSFHFVKVHQATGHILKDDRGEVRRAKTGKKWGGALSVVNTGLEGPGFSASQSVFFENAADLGGAVSIWNGSLKLNEVGFSKNSANDFGGALYCFRGGVTLAGPTRFDANEAAFGGALAFRESQLMRVGAAPMPNFANNRGSKGGKDAYLFSSQTPETLPGEIQSFQWPKRK
jgi:predicted outer membrane repeat protein